MAFCDKTGFSSVEAAVKMRLLMREDGGYLK